MLQTFPLESELSAMSDDGLGAHRARLHQRLGLALLVDVLFAGAMLLWWGRLSWVLMDPVRWATWVNVGPNPDLFEYPFVVLWGLPLAGVGLAWVVKLGGAMRWAVWIASFPPLYFGAIAMCFYVMSTPRF
jgi:hypothetical protein